MKIIKIIYDNDTKYILDITNAITIKVYKEEYNISNYKEKKNALPIMTRFGTTKVPLIVFEDENLNEFEAIWAEENPDWEKEINNILTNS